MQESMKLRLFVLQARQFIDSLHVRGIVVHTAILDDWRGVRVVVDTPEVRACRNECDTCRLHVILGESDSCEFRFEPKLFRWQKVVDKHWYGPSACLQCKTPAQFSQCYVNCLCEDPALDDQDDMNEEVGLIKNFIVLDTDETDDKQRFELKMKGGIISFAARSLRGERRAKFELALERHGWNFSQGQFK